MTKMSEQTYLRLLEDLMFQVEVHPYQEELLQLMQDQILDDNEGYSDQG